MHTPRRALHRASFAVIVAGALGSALLTWREGGPSASRIVAALLSIWVLMPFALLAVLNAMSARWTRATRMALQCQAWILTPLCLAVYGIKALRPSGRPAAAMFVALPPVSCVLILLTLGMAALAARGSRTAAQ